MFDFFISHSKEIKSEIAIPLAISLQNLYFSVWIDKKNIITGSHLYNEIIKAIDISVYGIIIIDENYLQRYWTLKELNRLYKREIKEKREIIIPIFCNVKKKNVYKIAPWLKNRAYEEINSISEYSEIVQFNLISRVLGKYYYDHKIQHEIVEYVDIIYNTDFPYKNVIIPILTNKYYLDTNLRLSTIELCNIQGIIWAIYNFNKIKNSLIIESAYHYSRIVQKYCYDFLNTITYDIYISCYYAVLSSLGTLIEILNIV